MNRDRSETRSPAVMMIGIVCLMVTTQIVMNLFTGNSRVAGPERGDIRVQQNLLPKAIGDWKFSDFKSPEGDGGVAGIIGWSHSWQATESNMSAIVSFDQVGFMGWHELTLCYEATGWTASNRKVNKEASSEGTWYWVSVDLIKDQNQSAVFFYSIFDGTGTPKLPPELQGYIPGDDLSSEQKRCLQCQVLVPFLGKLTSEQLSSIKNLHLETREKFRAEWIRQKSPK